MQNVEELKVTASRYGKIAPAFERIEAIDARLRVLDRDLRRPGGPPAKAEAVEAFVGWIRARRERFENCAAPSGRPRALDHVVRVSRGDSLHFSGIGGEDLLLDTLLWLLGPDIEDRAAEAVERLEYVEGLPAAERAQRRQALEAERAELVEEREQLVERCNSVPGFSVEHLPETRQRLNREAEHRRREEVQRARQLEAEQLLDTQA